MDIGERISAFWATILSWDEQEIFSHLSWLVLLIMFLLAAGRSRWKKKNIENDTWHDNRPHE